MKQLTWFLCIISLGSQAQTDTILLSPAVIKANRFQPDLMLHNADSLLVLNHPEFSVAGLFQKENYLYNRQYGANGVQTPGIRGLSAQQTAVLWNGIPLNNAALGVTDMSLIPSFFFDEVSIEPGASSSMNGNAAMGGSIHLLNAMPANSYLRLIGGSNSQQNYHACADASYRLGGVSFRTRLLFSNQKNEFYFPNRYKSAHPYEKLTHSKLSGYSGMQEISKKINKKGQFNFRIWGLLTDRQIPPTITQSYSLASMNDANLRSTAELIWFTSKFKTVHKIALMNEQNQYTDDLSHVNSSNRIRSLFISSDWDAALKNGLWGFYVQGFSAWGKSDNYLTRQEQKYFALGFHHEIESKKWKQQSALRYSISTGGHQPLTITSFTTYKLKKNVRFFLNLANGYRIPTLNEMFWIPGGNLDLLPEKSLHIEIGDQIQQKNLTCKNSIYFTPTLNMVQWLPTGAGIVSPINLTGDPTYLYGSETEFIYGYKLQKMSFLFKGSWHLNVAHHSDWKSFKQLDYVPFHRTNAEIRMVIKNFTLSLNDQFTSSRNILNESLPSFNLISAAASYIQKKIQISLSFNNLLNTYYEQIILRPMPGFNFQINLSYTFLKNSKS